jgi:DNA mismatch endonuclease (patch repair protein)
MDTVDRATRSRIMASVKTKNTDIELLVFRELRKRGASFRKHYQQLPGTPDIVFTRSKTAIFIDGDFWHGYRYPTWQKKIKSTFWRNKIETNILRDRRNFATLRRNGWKVLRFWGHEVKSDPQKVVSTIIGTALKARR